jgi:hypothetical protein
MASSPETMSAVFGSSLSSLNSQLMNHGWTKRPLNLEALGEREQNDVVAVLFELLGASVVCFHPSAGPVLPTADLSRPIW